MQRRGGGPSETGVWSRLLDGKHPWGGVGVWVPRGGVPRYSLTVYRPGIDPATRRLLRLWRNWPLIGGVGFFVVALATASVLPPPWPLVAAVAWCVAGLGVTGSLTRAERPRVRHLSLWDLDDAGLEEAAAFARLRCLGELLVAADDDLAAGRATPVQHALAWSTVYSELGRPGIDPARPGRRTHRPA